jgi:hypothetical protein
MDRAALGGDFAYFGGLFRPLGPNLTNFEVFEVFGQNPENPRKREI